MRDTEAKLRLLGGIKAKPAISVTEVTESLQFRSQARVFSKSSSGNKPFTVKEEVGLNFKKTFRKPNEKFTDNKNNKMCTRCGGKPHSSRPCPTLSKKNATAVKRWDTSQKCLEAIPNQIQVSTINRITCKEGNKSSEQASPESEMGMVYNKEQNLSMSATWEYISMNNCKVKMQVDTDADSKVI